jgi:hypothetical protein
MLSDLKLMIAANVSFLISLLDKITPFFQFIFLTTSVVLIILKVVDLGLNLKNKICKK